MRTHLVWILILLVPGAPATSADEFSAEDLEFFEKQVRPVLVERCHQCHGEKTQKGGLRLDSREAVLKGGDTGSAVVPGNVDESLLVNAINYDPDGYQMPPTGKLSADEIAALTDWVRRKAPWPAQAANATARPAEFNLRERAGHWSFQPIRAVTPPDSRIANQALQPIDSFLFARLEADGLTPAPPADRPVLIRRLSLELTGLPPTVEELEAFQADESPDAYERLSDRLFASPHCGERWARHWMDLVRFAETYGHEFDFEIRYPRPYRDYLIRAFNGDVPYDQLVREHVAGDLLPQQRRDPTTGNLDSVIGTAFWWFGQGKHSPVDIRAEECDTVDNQLDVFGKTFLGLTIACARCHDHKFDPITQRDYYALAGYLQSSRQAYADINPPEITRNLMERINQLDQGHRSDAVLSALDQLQRFAGRLSDLLLSRGDFQQEYLAGFQKRLKDVAAKDARHPLYLWAHWSADPGRLIEYQQALRQRLDQPSPAVAEIGLHSPSRSVGERDVLTEWWWEGFLQADRPADKLCWVLSSDAARPVRSTVAPQTWIHTGTVSPRLQGTIRTPTFTIEKPFIDILAYRRGGSAGPLRGDYKAGQIHLVIDGFQIIKSPLWGHLTVHVAQRDSAAWYRIDAGNFLGSRAYLELEDHDDGELIVEQIGFHDGSMPVQPYNELIGQACLTAEVQSSESLAMAYQKACERLIAALRNEEMYGVPAVEPPLLSDAADLINWMLSESSLAASLPAPLPSIAEFMTRRGELEAAIPAPRRTLAMTAGTPENEHLLIRGNHRKPGPEVPRRFLEVFGSAPERHADRLAMAETLVNGQNPLPPRVIVNRLWQHLFGRGLVPTPDDFGRMGQPPSHPELLDWVAAELIRGGWSLKHVQRKLVTSYSFRMSSQAADAVAEQRDPQNVLLHRAHIQRLEAEGVRDSLLLISGRLDDRMYGDSMPVHLTEFMEGRGRPGASGPLDGDGRRSLYINVRRNFLTPLFLAFDFPTPFTTMGRRSTSNVPAQALTLMNNPFVVQQAERWVHQAEARTNPRDRIQALYQAAFSRSATPEEVQAAEEFLAAQGSEYGSVNDPRAWTDLAHVLLNTKEFVFVE